MSAVYILANYQIPPGNSIAAGHDCLYEQSYPVLLNETFGRLMEAAGVGYTAMNVAMGNTRVVPYSYCVDAHAGLDADIVTWSFVSIVYCMVFYYCYRRSRCPWKFLGCFSPRVHRACLITPALLL